ncbi:MAG: hypothetical protein BGP16_00295 [Sphingobium sp. 66-54]|nr:MAG: hypothetical protein BGP16_00295 [Sphingobium sp. 66-54]
MTPSASPATQAAASLELLIGEMRGQMRELIHNINNVSQKLEALSQQVAASQSIPADIQALKGEVADLRARVTVLEAQENKRAGALGASSWLFRVIALLAACGAGGAIVKLIGG